MYLLLLVKEIFKSKSDITPGITKNIYGLKEPTYKLRNEANSFEMRKIKIKYYDLQSTQFPSSEIWNLIYLNLHFILKTVQYWPF